MLFKKVYIPLLDLLRLMTKLDKSSIWRWIFRLAGILLFLIGFKEGTSFWFMIFGLTLFFGGGFLFPRPIKLKTKNEKELVKLQKTYNIVFLIFLVIVIGLGCLDSLGYLSDNVWIIILILFTAFMLFTLVLDLISIKKYGTDVSGIWWS